MKKELFTQICMFLIVGFIIFTIGLLIFTINSYSDTSIIAYISGEVW